VAALSFLAQSINALLQAVSRAPQGFAASAPKKLRSPPQPQTQPHISLFLVFPLVFCLPLLYHLITPPNGPEDQASNILGGHRHWLLQNSFSHTEGSAVVCRVYICSEAFQTDCDHCRLPAVVPTGAVLNKIKVNLGFSLSLLR
jgi:hypothetical protein